MKSMGLFDFLKSKSVQTDVSSTIKVGSDAMVHLGKSEYADSRSIASDERPYYRPDDYYTTYSVVRQIICSC